MFCIYSSLEAEFFPALRVFDGDVILARPVDFQPGSGKRLEHVFAIADKPLLDVGPHIFMDGILGGGAVIFRWRFPPALQTGVVQIRMFRRVQTGADGIVRPGPAFPVVVHVAKHIKVFLPAGWAGVERLAAGKFHARNDEVQLMVACMGVPHPQDVALIRLQPRESHIFKVVHNPLFLFRRHRIVRVPGKHPSGELPFGIQRVDKIARSFHIPAQHFRRQLVPARIVRADKIVSRPIPTALAVRENFHIHDESSLPGGGGVSVPFSPRSRLTRATNTSITSARPLWMFTQRAS